MSVYFLLDIFSMFAGTILLRHDPEAAVPLQSIGWNKAFRLTDNSKMVKPKRSLTLGDDLYTQYHPTMMLFVVAILNCMLSIAFAYVPMSVPIDTIPCVFLLLFLCLILYPLAHWILHLFGFSTLYSLCRRLSTIYCPPPLPTYKGERGGKGVRKHENRWNGWRCLVEGGESVARVEWGWRRWPAWSKNETNK